MLTGSSMVVEEGAIIASRVLAASIVGGNVDPSVVVSSTTSTTVGRGEAPIQGGATRVAGVVSSSALASLPDLRA